MQVELTDLQPVLAEAQVATDQLMEEIEAKLPGVREQEEICRCRSRCGARSR